MAALACCSWLMRTSRGLAIILFKIFWCIVCSNPRQYKPGGELKRYVKKELAIVCIFLQVHLHPWIGIYRRDFERERERVRKLLIDGLGQRDRSQKPTSQPTNQHQAFNQPTNKPKPANQPTNTSKPVNQPTNQYQSNSRTKSNSISYIEGVLRQYGPRYGR